MTDQNGMACVSTGRTAEQTSAGMPTETIGFLLLPGFTLATFAAAIDPLRLANYVAGRPLYRWLLLSRDGAPERSSAAIAVGVEHGLDTAPALQTVIVCGGLGSHLFEDARTIAWRRRAASRGATIGALCIASHVRARAGLLEGYRCTIHWETLAGFTESFPHVDATGELFTIDRKRFTCAGGTASLDLMLHRIGAAHGPGLAVAVAEQLLHERIRAGSLRQQKDTGPDPRIERAELAAAIALMRETLDAPLEIDALARRIGASRRSLERLFKHSVACSPARYYLGLRLTRARQLLSQTSMSVTEVSAACGFLSATHFSKTYRGCFGLPPRDDQARLRLRALPEGFAPSR